MPFECKVIYSSLYLYEIICSYRPAEDYHDDYHRRPMAPVAAPYPVYDEPIRYP